MELPQLREHIRGNVVIVGVGNLLRGDDGFGPHMIEQLQNKVSATLMDCGNVPENFLAPIRRQRPNTILVLDTADFGASPGQIQVFDSSRWRGGGLSSHSLSLKMFADLLVKETQAGIFLVAIQPKQVGFGQNMSPEVREGCRRLQRWLETSLKPHS